MSVLARSGPSVRKYFACKYNCSTIQVDNLETISARNCH